MKSYKKATVSVSYGKVTASSRPIYYFKSTLSRYHWSFPKPSKGVFTITVPFKANASLCFNASQYSGAIKAYEKLASPIKTDKEKPYITN